MLNRSLKRHRVACAEQRECPRIRRGQSGLWDLRSPSRGLARFEPRGSPSFAVLGTGGLARITPASSNAEPDLSLVVLWSNAFRHRRFAGRGGTPVLFLAYTWRVMSRVCGIVACELRGAGDGGRRQ